MTAKADPQRPAATREAILVLGAHRSGTSAVTQLLALAGADLPQNLMPADAHNEKGYFEPWRIALLNDERLRAAGSAWDDVFAFPFRSPPEEEEAAWTARAADLFREEYATARRPLLKDPRVSVLLPFWRRVLESLAIRPMCVIPVRHPAAAAGSLVRRDGFSVEKALLVWTASMLACEAYSRDLPRAFVDYDALLADWRAELARLNVALDGALAALTPEGEAAIDAFLTPELRHNPSAGELLRHGWAGGLTERVYGWFEAAARATPGPAAVLDDAGDELARRAADCGALVSPAARDLDAARTELRDLRERLEFVRAEAAEERRKLEAARTADRETLERGWRRDVRRLEAQLVALREECAEAERRLDAVLKDD